VLASVADNERGSAFTMAECPFRALVAVLLAAVCSCTVVDGDDEPFADCGIGTLSGSWRIQYAESGGECGAIPDETGVEAPTASPGAGCSVQSSTISEDNCELDRSFTCPTADGLGIGAWIVALRQVSDTRLEGTGTLQVNHSTLGACRSTYDITITKL